MALASNNFNANAKRAQSVESMLDRIPNVGIRGVSPHGEPLGKLLTASKHCDEVHRILLLLISLLYFCLAVNSFWSSYSKKPLVWMNVNSLFCTFFADLQQNVLCMVLIIGIVIFV